MFGKSNNSKKIEMSKLSSLIASNIEINGDINFSEGLRVDGQINGSLNNPGEEKGLLVLSERGRIVGNVRTYDAVINGTIIGDVIVEHFLELQGNARITGNISYRQLQMDCGASVDGKLTKVDDESATKIIDFSSNMANAATKIGSATKAPLSSASESGIKKQNV